VLQVVVWGAYLLPVLYFFLRPGKAPAARAPAPQQHVAA
jgi:hypothetical protein